MQVCYNILSCHQQLHFSLRTPGGYPPDLQAVIDDDKAWFRARPLRQYRVRLTTQAELDDLRGRGVPLSRTAVAMATVVRNAPGGRIRVTVPLAALGHVKLDDYTEAQAAELWEMGIRAGTS